MKKLIVLLVIMIAIPLIIVEDSYKNYEYWYNNYPDLPKDDKWEFFKQRVFGTWGKTPMHVNKYEGPILYELYGASKQDSLAFNEMIGELKELIPNKYIGGFKVYTGFDLLSDSLKESTIMVKEFKLKDLKTIAIPIHFTKDSIDPKGTVVAKSSGLSLVSFRSIANPLKIISGYTKSEMFFRFPKKATIIERKESIQKEFIRLITCASFFDGSIKDTKIDVESSMLNSREDKNNGNQFTEFDRFLVQKLYSPDLEKEFSDYMYKTYPWRHANNYLNKEKTKIFAVWSVVLLTIVLTWIGFGLLYKKDLKYLFLSYFLPVLFFMLIILYGYKLYNYLTKPYDFEHLPQYIGIHIIFAIIASIVSLFLMMFDKNVLIDKTNFTKQFVLKELSTFIIALSPVIAFFLLENNPNSSWLKLNPLLLVVFAFTVGRGLLIYLNHFSENLVKQKDLELTKLRELNANAQVKLLHSQINPHFLYNALNSIAGLATVDGEKTEHMALALSDLFKYTINRKGEKFSTIKDELEMVNNYLEVEQIRFGDRLQFKIECDESLKGFEIPRFLIQPLIENAVKHGASKVQKKACIGLSIKKENHQIIIKATDNGPEFPEGLVSGHGLQSVYDLLELSYGNKAQLSWSNTPEKHISITIKQKDLNDE
ncbi:sensor histidine kinase [Aestuariibaculum suncheonense]|uniref:Histidine kinase n=1 Tax=Aestuariibaculum suncheonense TaxID=1028745 RepID=A0A8J6ULK0_9FLAO|nr:histidine kinase [Aestuariibaculum suncheonense]MBD0836416.1 histidine kinase [Aestuariibaculum suncheonense]